MPGNMFPNQNQMHHHQPIQPPPPMMNNSGGSRQNFSYMPIQQNDKGEVRG